MRAAAAAAILVLILGGCGNGDDEGGGETPERLGEPEGALDLIALPGYVEDGSADPAVDWVTPFERETGCEVSSTVAESPDEVVRLMRSGDYDGVSARGNVGLRLVEEGLVDPVNTDLIPSYADLFPQLKDRAHNTVDGVHYGVPQGRGANLMVWNSARVETEPDKPVPADLLFDPERVTQSGGRLAIPADPMFIADAAIYMREHDPDLGIENVFELDQEQFDATIELLREQRPLVGRYWSTPADAVEAFTSGAAVAGTARLVSVRAMLIGGVKVDAVVPKDGGTGFSDTWMLSSSARHPHCMYRWMNHVIGPETNAAVAVHTGQAPSNERACNLIGAHCDEYRAADEDLFDEVEYWATPLRDCGDDRGEVCKTYDEWAQAFAEVKG